MMMMANPQKENGFTPIANEIMDALAKTKFTELETKALFLIFRNTYGWGRKVWQVKKWKAFEEIGIHKCCIKRELTRLAERQIIKLNWESKTIEFQKDYSKWTEIVSQSANQKKLANELTSDEKVSQPANNEVSQPANKKLANQLTQVSQPANSESRKATIHQAPPVPKERSKDIKKEEKETSSSSSNNGISNIAKDVPKIKRAEDDEEEIKVSESEQKNFDRAKKLIEAQYNNFFYLNESKGLMECKRKWTIEIGDPRFSDKRIEEAIYKARGTKNLAYLIENIHNNLYGGGNGKPDKTEQQYLDEADTEDRITALLYKITDKKLLIQAVKKLNEIKIATQGEGVKQYFGVWDMNKTYNYLINIIGEKIKLEDLS